MRGLLVTGTDTGVGKTVVACALAETLRESGVRVVVWKPAETGWNDTAESDSDAARLRAAARSRDDLEAICPYRFHAPLAPALAARLENRTIDIDRLTALYGERSAAAEIVLVEGAGGLLVPIADGWTYVDLARRLNLAVLVVAANRLGVINHTALTVRVALQAGCRVIGFVLNHPAKIAPGHQDLSSAFNRSSIEELVDRPCLGEIPNISGVSETRPGDHLDVDGILARL